MQSIFGLLTGRLHQGRLISTTIYRAATVGPAGEGALDFDISVAE